MTHSIQQLLALLYEASHEEREALRKILDRRLAEEAQKTLSLNDFDRKEQVDAIMQDLLFKTKMDYFHAAMIYYQGSETVEDVKKARQYAENALDPAVDGELTNDAEKQLTSIQDSLLKKQTNPSLTLEPGEDKVKKKKKEEEEVLNQLTCSNCGKGGHTAGACLVPKK